MEIPFKLVASDGKIIHGYFHQANNQAAGVAILVHGLTGHMNEYLHLVVARSLEQARYSVIRFNQYADDDGGRRFDECTLDLHVADTLSVVSYAKSLGFKKIVLIGHSLGGPISIAAACRSELAGIVLWDPAASPAERLPEWQTYDAAHKISYLNWQMKFILGENWIESAKNFPNSFEQLATLDIPIKIIEAETGGKAETCERYMKACKHAADYKFIPNSSHTFVEAGAAENLYKETEKFLAEI